MKYFLLILLIVVGANAAVFAQVENWDTYMAKFDGKPGSVLVDLGQFEKAPDKRYPYLVITGPQSHNCTGKGLPNADEISVMEDMLDATTTFLTGVTMKVLTGTLTYNCSRVNYYYVKDSTGVRTAIQRMYARNYKDYKYVLTIKSDPDWRTYLTFLYPTNETLNWMENEKILEPMIKAGDSLLAPREIVFEAIFKTDTGRDAFAASSVKKGYKVVRSVTAKMGDSDASMLNFSRQGALNTDSLSVWSAEIKHDARLHGGIYNGWTAPVIRRAGAPRPASGTFKQP